ncbi:MAG: 50S ribosomal protein L23 [Thermoprotei archaeon]|nr:MAG: 50S ribosomal protein L23 [Thermoprotei archaeon]
MEAASVVVRPHVTEKTLMLAERENVLTLIVRIDATKHQVREAVEKLFGVKVVKVNTLITSRGEKKAYVKLAPEHRAIDVLTRMGVI